MNIDPAVNDNLKEQAAHGSHEFPLQVYQDMEYCENGLILYNHWHEEAEILFVTEGMMELVVDGISIIAGKDTIVLIPPNQLHGAYQYGRRRCTGAQPVPERHPHAGRGPLWSAARSEERRVGKECRL